MLSLPLDVPALAGTTWSVQARIVETGEVVLDQDATRLVDAASTAKIFLLVEVADRLARGEFDDVVVDRRSVEPVLDSGLWQFLETDTLSVRDAARLVGSVSDNWATNALIELVGLSAVQDRARRMTTHGSMLHDVVRSRRSAEHPRTLSEGAAADWVDVVTELERGALASRSASVQVVDWLSSGLDLSMVAGAFDLDPLSHGSPSSPDVRLWNKTGTDAGVRSDVGVVRLPHATVAYAATCTWSAQPEDGTLASVLTALRAIGRLLRSV